MVTKTYLKPTHLSTYVTVVTVVTFVTVVTVVTAMTVVTLGTKQKMFTKTFVTKNFFHILIFLNKNMCSLKSVFFTKKHYSQKKSFYQKNFDHKNTFFTNQKKITKNLFACK